jgi:hypothetical protein
MPGVRNSAKNGEPRGLLTASAFPIRLANAAFSWVCGCELQSTRWHGSFLFLPTFRSSSSRSSSHTARRRAMLFRAPPWDPRGALPRASPLPLLVARSDWPIPAINRGPRVQLGRQRRMPSRPPFPLRQPQAHPEDGPNEPARCHVAGDPCRNFLTFGPFPHAAVPASGAQSYRKASPGPRAPDRSFTGAFQSSAETAVLLSPLSLLHYRVDSQTNQKARAEASRRPTRSRKI